MTWVSEGRGRTARGRRWPGVGDGAGGRRAVRRARRAHGALAAPAPCGWRRAVRRRDDRHRALRARGVRQEDTIRLTAARAVRSSTAVSEAGAGRAWPPGRNEPCWCGSERKYKRCCGALTMRESCGPRASDDACRGDRAALRDAIAVQANGTRWAPGGTVGIRVDGLGGRGPVAAAPLRRAAVRVVHAAA